MIWTWTPVAGKRNALRMAVQRATGAAHLHTGNLSWQVASDNGGAKAALRALAATMNKPG